MHRLIALVLTITLAGCETTRDVRQAHRWERDALVAYRAENQALGEAFVADLRLSWVTQVGLVHDYELRLRAADGKVEVEQARDLLAGARRKLTEIEGRITAIRRKVKATDVNYEIALRLHDAVDEYLDRRGLSQEEQVQFLERAAELAIRIDRTLTENSYGDLRRDPGPQRREGRAAQAQPRGPGARNRRLR